METCKMTAQEVKEFKAYLEGLMSYDEATETLTYDKEELGMAVDRFFGSKNE